ncbi:unnamed protein product, partial [marine sediment metagenome]
VADLETLGAAGLETVGLVGVVVVGLGAAGLPGVDVIPSKRLLRRAI